MRAVRLGLIAAGIFVALVVVIGAAAALYLTLEARPRVQAAASDALGVEVIIQGALHIGLFPAPHVAIANIHLRSRGAEFASIGEADLGMGLSSAIRREARIDGIVLKQVTLSLARDVQGRLNVEVSGPSEGPLPDVSVARIKLSKTTLAYRDDRTGSRLEAADCAVDVSRLRLLPGNRTEWLRNLSFGGQISCGRLRLTELTAADVKVSLDVADGVIDGNPIRLRLFEGEGSGSLRADFSRAVPLYQARYRLAQFHLEEFFRTLSPKAVGRGAMDFSADLSFRGSTAEEARRSAQGTAALRGENLTLETGDLDKKFSEFASTQNFTLVDAGAFFFAGPVGLGISKGYDYARILRETKGSTFVQALVSEWKIDQGVAHATDVAMATNKNRVALKGGLDLISDQFVDVTVALVDANGCTEAEQKLAGSFLKPTVTAPSVLRSLAEPTRRLFSRAAGLLGRKCVPFYTGSVQAPAASPAGGHS